MLMTCNYYHYKMCCFKKKIEAMFGMLGGGENMSENLSGCLFTLGISLDKGTGGGGERTYLNPRWEASYQCASQCSSTQTVELVVQVFDTTSTVLTDGKF